MKRISILMCSYNGDSLLSKTVSAITKLDVHSFDFVEFIFVDNASANDLQECVRNIWKQSDTTIVLKTLLETKKGKTAAFLSGFKLCEGDYIVVCDDDNELYENYLVEGATYLDQHPEVGVLGGNGIPTSQIEIPTWLMDYLPDFACGPQAKRNGNVFPGKNVVYGAGMWFRSSSLKIALSAGFEFMFDYVKDDPSLKRMSNGGEDGELCWAIKYQNYEIHYLDNLKFNHIIDKHKITHEYLNLLKSRKSKYTLLGQVYRRALNMNSDFVTNFWLKELVYIFVNYFKNFRFNRAYLLDESRRNWCNIYFLLIYRRRYDAIINQLLKYKSNFIG